METGIRVLVVEDNRLLRDRLVAVLGRQPGLQVIVAEGADRGLRRAAETQPDVVLVKASLGNGSSHRFVGSVRRTAPQAGVVVMALHPGERDLLEFAKAGATGFVPNHAGVDDLAATVRSVARGAAVVPAPLRGALLSHIAKEGVARSAPGASDAERMSKREREVIGLIAEGLSNKEIGLRLHIATHTVKTHVHNILVKLVLHNRLQIAAHALRAGESARESP